MCKQRVIQKRNMCKSDYTQQQWSCNGNTVDIRVKQQIQRKPTSYLIKPLQNVVHESMQLLCYSIKLQSRVNRQIIITRVQIEATWSSLNP